MATTTIAVDTDTKFRLEWYKLHFKLATMEDVVRDILDTAGVASSRDIKRRQKMKYEGETPD